ncbi:hypothetical protein Taro_006624, partial [Colocasia esculenta]|nr:hypothetical protein [Colocasia esculenta]
PFSKTKSTQIWTFSVQTISFEIIVFVSTTRTKQNHQSKRLSAATSRSGKSIIIKGLQFCGGFKENQEIPRRKPMSSKRPSTLPGLNKSGFPKKGRKPINSRRLKQIYQRCLVREATPNMLPFNILSSSTIMGKKKKKYTRSQSILLKARRIPE